MPLTKLSSNSFPFGGNSTQFSTAEGSLLGKGLTTSVDRALQTTAGRFEWLTLVLRDMTDGDGCQHNCSGHGTCDNGMCVCMVQYAGDFCQDKNTGYFVAFGSIFATLSAVAIIQLALCIHNEYIRQKHKSVKKVLRINAQKLLYVLTFFATAIKCIYFFTKWSISDIASSNLSSAFYPVMLSGFSFIICFWAEAFHLGDIKFDKPRFLGKSIIGFLTFNFLMYALLFLQLVSTEIIDDLDTTELITKVCNCCFACLMIVAVVFFLGYGVEVYFKVHGAFNSRTGSVDTWQLHASRLGLIAQAILQLVTALFIIADVKGDIWKNHLPIISQNFYDIGFRIVEFGVVLWFPCVLWNCKSPENLWVLNPTTLFKSLKTSEKSETDAVRDVSQENYGSVYQIQGLKQDCWICYDPDRTDAGTLIQPCQCRGDVASVHHECLRKWLIECADQQKELKCKVCNESYKVSGGWSWFPRGLKPRHWLQNFLILIVITSVPFITYAITHSVTSLYIRIFVIGACILVEIGCLRILASSFGVCYKRGRLSTLTISGREVNSVIETLPMPSTTSLPAHSANVETTGESVQCSKNKTNNSSDCGTLNETFQDIPNSLSVKAVIEQS
ncbi:uncharacterized protein LOC133172899 [Saccostrea echinata]|uniref:uncharacterized protein LOC133172899 n=1 Tax=Saccostrea echinata TaxID=191078 RepID=UPI002A813CEA|nr:uncharacterized protein LOC133172899 [Saccostrea echinata]